MYAIIPQSPWICDLLSQNERKVETAAIQSYYRFKFFIMQALKWKKYTSGPRYWNVPVLVNTGTFLVFQYCLKMWYLRSLGCAGVIQKLTILEHKNGLVLSNTRVPVSGTWSILFPSFVFYCFVTSLTSYISVCKLVTLHSFCGSRSHITRQ